MNFFLFVQNHDMVRKSAKMKFNFYIWYTIKDNNIFEYDEKGIQIGDISLIFYNKNKFVNINGKAKYGFFSDSNIIKKNKNASFNSQEFYKFLF